MIFCHCDVPFFGCQNMSIVKALTLFILVTTATKVETVVVNK